MQTDIPPLSGRAGIITRDQFREEVLAVLRESHPAASIKSEDFAEAKPRTKAIEVWNGSVCVRIYPTKWRNKKRRKIYRSYILAWRLHKRGKLFRQKLSRLEEAKKRAEQIAGSIANGQTNLLQFSQADIASFQRSRELLKNIGDPPIESAIGIYTQCVQILNGVCPLEASRYYNLQHPCGTIPKQSADVVQEFFAKRKMSNKWKKNLKTMLDRFIERFPGPLTQLIAREVEDWLDGIKGKNKKVIGPHARHNHRAAVVELCNFAKTRGYLAEAWRVMDSVSDPELPNIRINIYTPDELLRLLNKAETYDAGRKLVPFIAITAFAGVRHGEMNEDKIQLLDWRQVNFNSKTIYVAKDTAKTGNDRIVDMPDNLVAWLKPYARPSGKIVSLKNTGDALCRLRSKAGIKGNKRNALRKSFISYKKALSQDIARVADQAGNSAALIRKNYLWVDDQMEADARRWFSLMPDRADILPLFAWSNRASN